jgi:flagellar hook-associated protein 2
LDVSQDAEQAVTAVQNFLTAYNDVLTWIQTRLTEKAVDESKKATLDSDDFRMRWGVLNGSALLRNTKDGLRYRTSRIYAVPFTQRSSSKAIYGAMSQNGIVNPGTFTVTVGTRTLSVAVDPADTLTDIAAKINSPTVNGGEKNPLIVDATENGVTRTTVYAKAVVENGKIRIEAGTDEPVSLSGNAILTALGLNYQYTTLSQIGIKLSSDGTIKTQGQTGELEFDTSVFMTALENNADDVSMVMTNFASEMQTYMDDLLKSSQKEIATGVTAAQGAVAREINAIDSEIQSIDKYLTEFDKRLQNKQEALFKQFSAAETSLAKLIQQANWLASVTAQLSSSGTSSASA